MCGSEPESEYVKNYISFATIHEFFHDEYLTPQ